MLECHERKPNTIITITTTNRIITVITLTTMVFIPTGMVLVIRITAAGLLVVLGVKNSMVATDFMAVERGSMAAAVDFTGADSAVAASMVEAADFMEEGVAVADTDSPQSATK